MGDVWLIREAMTTAGLDVDLTLHRDGEEMFRFIESIDDGQTPCPDVVLLDLNLPKRNGEAILRRIRESPVCGKVPVVIVTSSTAENDRETTARLGATQYFCKPSDYDEYMRLGTVVSRVLAD